MEIEITSLLTDPRFDPWVLCNSVANLGDNAGEVTWTNSQNLARKVHPPLLDTPEKRRAFRKWANEYSDFFDGIDDGVYDNNIARTNALFLQWIAGDIRECFGDMPYKEWDWGQYERDAEAGRCPSNIFRANGKVYFSLY
jgi:hypothetical protein